MSLIKLSHLEEALRESKNNFLKESVLVAENQLRESRYKRSEDLFTRNILCVLRVIHRLEMVPFTKKRANHSVEIVINLFSAKNARTVTCLSPISLSLRLDNLGTPSVLFVQVVAPISLLDNSSKEKEGHSVIIASKTCLQQGARNAIKT